MDGASKFVKGDAIAGSIVSVINIVGCITLGMTGVSTVQNYLLEKQYKYIHS